MKNRKRILATVLAAIMTISMLPASTFATEMAENEVVEIAEEAVSMPEEVQEVETAAEDISEETAEETEEIDEAAPEEAEADDIEAEADDVEVAAEEITETEEIVEEEEISAETVAWPVTRKAEGDDYIVTVAFDENAGLPADAQVRVEEILSDDKVYDNYVEQAADKIEADVENVSYARLFDISLVDADGGKLEPTGPVDVKIRLKDIDKAEETPQVVHFAGEEEIPEIIDAEIKGKDVSFETDGFSIYAIIGTGDYERLTVNFYGADQENPIDTMWVKKVDKTNGQLDKIIYDPGVGTLEDRYAFYGWSIGDPDYAVADCVNDEGEPIGKSINDVKDYIRELDFSDGDVLNVYAMLLTYYKVDYVDEEGVSLGSDRALVKEAGASADYVVNKGYSTDGQHHFEGWLPVDGVSNITDPADATNETLFPNETPIKIKGDVKFSVSAPEGNWLVFDENGKHATYNAPRFIYTGYKPSDPEPEGGNLPDSLLEMKRKGYVFDGWYTADGDPFNFDQVITETTTAYAHWTKNSTAPYTVIIWKEGVTKGTWDFEQTLTFTGNVDETINTVVPTGSGDNRYARIDGTDYKYTGFRYDHHDTGETVTPEGDAVVNVYYVRNTYTLTFQSSIWIPFVGHFTFNTITARYGTDISSYFPVQASIGLIPGVSEWFSSLARWEAQNGTTFTKPVVFIDTMPAESITFYTDRSLVSEKQMYYYAEALPGDTVDRTFNGKSFTLLSGPLGARYNYFTEDEDFLDIIGYDKYGSEPAFVNGRADGNVLRCYYTRQLKTINYMNGAYYDGNDLRTDVGTGQLGTAEGIPYNSDISSYNKGGTNYFEPENPPEGYVFEGWYIDQTCTVPYTFNRMSSGGITVYAKWREIQYRVFLESQAYQDMTLDWGSENQAMNFRVSYGEKVSAPEGTRTGYKFLGWHKDKNGNVPVYLDGLYLNETTVTEAYDKSKDFTDNWDRWGSGRATTNADVDRFWMTKKFVLYASWSKIATGAEGIGINYVVEPGSGNIYDSTLYQDNTSAVAAGAPTAPEGKVFKGWVVQKWNGNDFVDTDVEVLPGRNFKVLLDNAKVFDVDAGQVVPLSEVVEGKEYQYTIQVRAEYEDKENAVPTHITWYKNYEDDEPVYRNDTTGADGKPLKINEAVKIYGIDEAVPERTGYNFLGWAKDTERTNPGDSANITSSKTTADFLEYRDGKYYLASDHTTEVTEVAADELTPYEGLYAIWEKAPFYVYHSSDGRIDELTLEEGQTTFDLTEIVSDHYLYGGYYHYDEVDGERTKGDAYTDNGKALEPGANTYYYLKEVDERHLRPKVYLLYNTNHNRLIQRMYGIVSFDEIAYQDAGLIINGEKYGYIDGVADLAEEKIEVVETDGEGNETVREEITSSGYFGPDGVLALVDLSDMIDGGAKIRIKGYYKTPDGVVVTGNKDRMIQFAAGDDRYEGMPLFTGWNNAGNTKTGLKTSESETTYEGRSAAGRMKAVRMLSISSPSDKAEYKIMKIYDSGTEEQVVEGGDCTGKVTYAAKSGYLFAGWFQDTAFTVPADFSDVTGDLTVYAKYVSTKDVKLAFKRTGKKGNVTNFTATVTVKGQEPLEDVSVNIAGGNAVVLANRTVKKSTTEYKGSVGVEGLAKVDSFKAYISWTTPDGTVVAGAEKTCNYREILGSVTVR